MSISTFNRRIVPCLLAGLCLTLVPQAGATPLLSQDFNTSVTAGGWTTANYLTTSPVNWGLNTNFLEENWTGGAGTAAMMDSFSYRSQAYNAALISPIIGLPSTQQPIQLTFRTVFEPWSGDETADVDISTNGGSTWTTLQRWTNLSTAVEGLQSLSLNGYAGSSVKLRFRYYNSQATAWDNYWQIDDVSVELAGLRGDYNLNGIVDLADYGLWADSFLQTGGNLPADGNGNGWVDIADYTVWADNFGQTATGMTVPEPASAALLVLGALTIARRRRLR